MSEKHVCPNCKKFVLKQIKSRKNGKFWWVCQGPTDDCGAIFPDDKGKPDFPVENPGASGFVKWLIEDDRMHALTEFEETYVQRIIEKDEGDFYTSTQIRMLKGIADKFADSPEF